jgi:hypothetical protein
MSSYGFVYMLANDYMPDVVKIGCTERSPHARALELSKATGVPAAFRVVCFVEVPDFQHVELRFHKWLDEFRISAAREFFRVNEPNLRSWTCGLFMHFPDALSFTDVDVDSFTALDERIGPYLPNPFKKHEVEKPVADDGQPKAQTLQLVAVGGADVF